MIYWGCVGSSATAYLPMSGAHEVAVLIGAFTLVAALLQWSSPQ